MLSLSVLPLSFLICVYMTFSNLLVFFIIDWFVVFGRVRVQQSEINQGCFFINGSFCWCWWKIIWGNYKTSVFFIYQFYIYFAGVFIPVNFTYIFFVYNDFINMICKKSFVMLSYCSILVISLNILFVSAHCLHKYWILLIAKNTLLLKAFASKSGMLSDVIVTVYLNK